MFSHTDPSSMHRFMRFILGLAMTLSSAALLAEDVVKVNAINYPAWVVRNHQTKALIPGYKLRADDLIRTGKKGRVILQLVDGSAIKLGESVRFLISSVDVTAVDEQSFLEASFQVLRGAFRYTSSIFGHSFAGHRLNVKVGAITAGIRGTDIWGRSNLEQDLVALIEGAITVDIEGEPTVKLEQALNYYVKPRDEAPLTIAQIDAEQLQRWAKETELDAAMGIAAENGEWSLVLLSVTNRKKADRELKLFHEKGFAVKRKSVIRNGKTLHRLLLPGFVSIEDAVNAGTQVSESLGISDAWVWRQ